ncbi:GNAT family N-acetyltransferase [Stigmatella erecta]|uniref:Ribosomal-protein-alanine N-acetyltransferase n=1 Tax=Stigmatella erecta TaxID=83460 RepID=A0A1I0KJW9_9BACT|nr:GNAT family N-acetyltransferase [Stigmatella erecta]SEU25102.1 ribosomal-protein-alanine N-acetyltransferase [Stigmatella erecta]
MTMKQVDPGVEVAVPVMDAANPPNDLASAVKMSPPTDEDMSLVASLRASSDPWKSRGETQEESLQALTQLRPFLHVAKLQGQAVGYVTVERDGPVPGAAYMRNIVVRPDLRKQGLGMVLLNHGVQTARDMYRKTLALRVDPANGPAVSFYRKAGFTTVATVVSKKSGKLRLLMSREL